MQIAEHTHRRAYTHTHFYEIVDFNCREEQKKQTNEMTFILCLCMLALDIVLGVLLTHTYPLTHVHTHTHT